MDSVYIRRIYILINWLGLKGLTSHCKIILYTKHIVVIIVVFVKELDPYYCTKSFDYLGLQSSFKSRGRGVGAKQAWCSFLGGYME